MNRLDPPIFSPATKAESGHDENITISQMQKALRADVTSELERLTRLVYTRGRDVALRQGIVIADTKFEFGRTKSGEILLIDEVMTPDSSRFWPLDGCAPGRDAFGVVALLALVNGVRRRGVGNHALFPESTVVAAIEVRQVGAIGGVIGECRRWRHEGQCKEKQESARHRGFLGVYRLQVQPPQPERIGDHADRLYFMAEEVPKEGSLRRRELSN